MGSPRGARPYETIKADADSPFTQYLVQLDQAIIRIDQELCLISGWESDLGQWYTGQDLWLQAEDGQVELRYFYHLNYIDVPDHIPDESTYFHMDDFPYKEVEFDQIELQLLRYDLEEVCRAARWEWRPPHLDSEIGPSLVRCRDLFVTFEDLAARVGNIAASKDAGEIGESLWNDYNAKGVELLQLIDDLFSLTRPPTKGEEAVTHNKRGTSKNDDTGKKKRGREPTMHRQIVRSLCREGKEPTVEVVKQRLKSDYGLDPDHEDWPTDANIERAIRREPKRVKSKRHN